MSKLVVTRPSGFIHKKQKYKVLIDGNEIGTINSGETAEFVLPAGPHTLQTGIGKWSGMSPVAPFNLSQDETVSYTTQAHKMSIVLFFLAVLMGVGFGRNISHNQVGFAMVNLILIVIIFFGLRKIAVTLKRSM